MENLKQECERVSVWEKNAVRLFEVLKLAKDYLESLRN